METGRTGSAIGCPSAGGRRSKRILSEEAVRLVAESFRSPQAYVLLPPDGAGPCIAAVPAVVGDAALPGKSFKAKERARWPPSRSSAPMRPDRFWDLLLWRGPRRSAGGGREAVVSLVRSPSRTFSYAWLVFMLPWTGRPGWTKAKALCSIASLDSTRRASTASTIASVGVVSAICAGLVPVSNSFVEGTNARLALSRLITSLDVATGSAGREAGRRPLRPR